MKTIKQIAYEVLDGKWGSSDKRKTELEKAGYDYYAVQNMVNKIFDVRAKVVGKMNAYTKRISSEKYHYVTWKSKDFKTHTCPICNGRVFDDHFGWNCIGYSFSVWHHGGGIPCKCNCGVIANEVGEAILLAKTDAEALRIAQSHVGIKSIEVIRNKSGIPKSKWNAGDICMKFDGDTYKHTFYYEGDGKISDSSYRGGDGSSDIAIRSYKNYSAKVIIRFMSWETIASSDKYSGEMPTLKIVKTNAEVIADAVRFACWIAGDNDFHYGYTDKHGSDDPKKWHPNAHHNGCYFCGTNVDHGGRSKAGIVDYEKTYCCNPFVGACWAHGGCVPKALALCQKGSSWGFSEGSGYDTSNLFDRLGKPSKSKLKAGDVLCSDSHVALYIGNGKMAEAASGDDNVRHSKSWNKSIRATELTDSRYKGFKRVHRFNGSVNATANIYFGEISGRVKLLQKYLKWYGYDIDADGIFGEETHKAVKGMQKSLGVAVDGIVGAKTLAAMNSHRK